MRYRPEIDGLRAVAVLPVILFHAGFVAFSGGFIGVDVFFVISGYLITGILLDEIRDNRFSVAGFYERRARRILPALTFVVLCCLPFAYLWMIPEQMAGFARSIVSVGLFVSNIFFWQESGYFAPETSELPLLHTWSLAVEEQFYILFPLLLFQLCRSGRQRALVVICVLAVASLVLSEWGWRHAREANFYLSPTRAWELFAGSICAFRLQGKTPGTNPVLGAVGLALILFAVFYFDADTPTPSLYALVPVGGAVLIILQGGTESRVGWLLSRRIFVGIGLISYSAYLWHQPLFAFVRIHMAGDPGQIVMGSLCLITLGLAVLTWRYVERPFRGKGAFLPDRRKLLWVSGTVCAGLVAIGLIGQAGQGMEFRMDSGYRARVANLSASVAARKDQARAFACLFDGGTRIKIEWDSSKDWPCPVTGLENGEKPVAALFGDSHAADAAVALRHAGYTVLPLTGNGCPLQRDAFSGWYCTPILDLFLQAAKAQGIRTVILANDFADRELSPAVLARSIELWTSNFDNVILLSPIPEFARFGYLYTAFGEEFAQGLRPDYRLSDMFYAALDELGPIKNLHIVDSRVLLCGGRDPCTPIDGDNLLMIDKGHLGPAGFSLFATNLQAMYGDLLESVGMKPCDADCRMGAVQATKQGKSRQVQ